MTLHLWMKGLGPASDSTKEEKAAFYMVISVKMRASTTSGYYSLTVLCVDLCNCAADATTGAGQQHILRLEQLFCHDRTLNDASYVSPSKNRRQKIYPEELYRKIVHMHKMADDELEEHPK